MQETITHWSIATGRDVKVRPVAVTPSSPRPSARRRARSSRRRRRRTDASRSAVRRSRARRHWSRRREHDEPVSRGRRGRTGTDGDLVCHRGVEARPRSCEPEAEPETARPVGGPPSGRWRTSSRSAGRGGGSLTRSCRCSRSRRRCSTLSRDLWSVAVQLAANAGYTRRQSADQHRLLLPHPNVIGRKIRADERGARDGVGLDPRRHRQADAPMAGPGSATPAPHPRRRARDGAGRFPRPPANGRTDPRRSSTSCGGVRPPLHRHERRRELRDGPARRTRSRGSRGRTTRRARTRREAAGRLLEAARKELAAAVKIGVVSATGRRASSSSDLAGPERQGQGQRLPVLLPPGIAKGLVDPGDFEPEAVARWPSTSAGTSRSPGFSNHQDGLAIDFGRSAKGKRLAHDRMGARGSDRWLARHATKHSASCRSRRRRGTGRTARRRTSREVRARSRSRAPAARGRGAQVPRVPAARAPPRQARRTSSCAGTTCRRSRRDRRRRPPARVLDDRMSLPATSSR